MNRKLRFGLMGILVCLCQIEITQAQTVLYSEDFTTGSVGWRKIVGPGTLQADSGYFRHLDASWANYVQTQVLLGKAKYRIDVLASSAYNTSFVWRHPDTLSQITENNGAYSIGFNTSPLVPPVGHFRVEKFDQTGRFVLLELDSTHFGWNTLEIHDYGSLLLMKLNGSFLGKIDVSPYTPVSGGYLALAAGDWNTGDGYDNISVSTLLSGDANLDMSTSLADVIYIVNYIFGRGNGPELFATADVNCDTLITLSDVIFLVNYLFNKPGDWEPCEISD